MTNIQRLILFIVLLLLNPGDTFSISNYNAGDTLYVWAPKGIMLREEKSDYSNKILAIKYGEKVIVQESREIFDIPVSSILEIDLDKNNRIDEIDFCLTGLWVKIRYGNSIGYVFDGFLSKLTPINISESFVEYADRNFVKLKVFKYFKEGHQMQYHVIYDNGIMINMESNINNSNGGLNTYLLPLSVEEAYLIFYARHYSESTEYSSFKKNTSKNYEFEFELGGMTICDSYNYVLVSYWWGN